MLTELRISNFAVVDHLDVEFSSGFQVLTGESGAGKSVIIEAIALIVGGRASVDQIRSGADEAVLEAAFSFPPDSSVAARFRDIGCLEDGRSEAVIRRILSRHGRHRVYVNGALTPLHIIQHLAGTLIDIHGQHEQQSLLSAQAQLDALDAYGGLMKLRRQYGEQYHRWKTCREELAGAERASAERSDREELLRFQHRELIDAGLRSGEAESLEAERHRLAHARRLAELEHEAYEALYEDERSVLAGLGMITDRVRALGGIDPDVKEWETLCHGAAVLLRDLAQRMRTYRDGLEQDPERLADIEDRLARLHRLQKKYGETIEELLVRTQDLQRQLDMLEATESRVEELRRAVEEEWRRTLDLAKELSQRRRRAADRMQEGMEAELAALRMEQTTFRIQIRQTENREPTETGMDCVEYVLSANQGEPLLPLADVASGGELSRIMLALKTVLAQADGVPVLIFDEVDSGVDGAVAAVMGRRLRGLSKYHQVVCITHLPQIASQADTHFLVSKEVVKKRTVTRVGRLDRNGRRQELARMLAGLSVTKTALARAEEMIDEGAAH